MEKIRILLVDDDRQNSELLRKFLEVEGYEVFYAENGHNGWETFTTTKPDLVLLDINMPLMKHERYVSKTAMCLSSSSPTERKKPTA